MARQVNNTRKCIDCFAPVPRKVKRCPDCNQIFLRARPTYRRSPEHNQLMSVRTRGIPKTYLTGGSLPGVAEKIQAAWTDEMREAARLRGQALAQDREWRLRCGQPGEQNPMWEDGRSVIPYARGWAKKWKLQAWERAGYHCEICLGDKPVDTHHKDFRKDNHSLENLQVLCRKCHKRLHAENRRAYVRG